MSYRTNYRTPEEIAKQDEAVARINRVLDEAADAGSMLYAAMLLGETQDVIELWTNRTWDAVRSLSAADRAQAIVTLLTPRIRAGAYSLMDGAR